MTDSAHGLQLTAEDMSRLDQIEDDTTRLSLSAESHDVLWLIALVRDYAEALTRMEWEREHEQRERESDERTLKHWAECATCGWRNESRDEAWTRRAGEVHVGILKPGHRLITEATDAE